MTRSRWIALVVVLVVAALSVQWWRSRHAEETTKFRTAAVDRGAIEAVVSATGTVTPVIQVEVGSQVSGTVAELFSDYNATVKKGQVLCQLDPSSFKAREVQAEASVAHAEAALLDAQRQYRRAKELLPDNYVSQADVDAAEVQVQQRQADLKQARAQLEAAKVDLANTTIRAPIDGVVISRNVDRGQTVAASLQAPKLFVIANDLHAMQIQTSIDESDVGQIHAGLPVTFTVDAFPDLTFHGEVEQVRLEPIVQQNVVTYTTVVGTRNPDLKLKPGMTANVTVLISRRDDVLKVPNAALRFRPPMNGRKKGGWGANGALAGNDGTPVASAAENQRPPGGGARDPAGGGARGGGAWGPGARGGAEARGGAAGAGAPDPAALADLRRQLFEQVRRGELTQEQAMEMLRDRAARGGAGAAAVAATSTAPPRTATIYVMRDGKPQPVRVQTGITDGAFTEVHGDELKPGDTVIVGLDLTSRSTPPGMGNPVMGGRR